MKRKMQRFLKRVVTMFLVCSLIVTVVPISVLANAVDNGQAAAKSIELQEPECVGGVYQISDATELRWFSELVNGTLTDGTVQNTDANAVLVDDITCNGITIGSETNQYNGTFNGNNHTIFDTSTSGLFGYTNGTIKNLTLQKKKQI